MANFFFQQFCLEHPRKKPKPGLPGNRPWPVPGPPPASLSQDAGHGPCPNKLLRLWLLLFLGFKPTTLPHVRFQDVVVGLPVLPVLLFEFQLILDQPLEL